MNKTFEIVIPTTGQRKSIFKTIQALSDQTTNIRVITGLKPAEARNKALNESSADYIVFLDDDCIPKEDFFSKGKKQIIEAGFDIAQSKVIGGINNSEDIFISAALWVNRKVVLDSIAGFDEAYPFYNEDLDFYLRATNVGLLIGYLEESIVWHPDLGNFEKLKLGNDRLKEKFPSQYKKLINEIR